MVVELCSTAPIGTKGLIASPLVARHATYATNHSRCLSYNTIRQTKDAAAASSSWRRGAVVVQQIRCNGRDTHTSATGALAPTW
jgi:hypothetical protein